MNGLTPMDPDFYHTLSRSIIDWATELGFQQAGIADADTGDHEAHLERWLELGRHGEMDYMARHGTKRSRPDALIEGTRTVIAVRLNYLPEGTRPREVLASDRDAYVSRYALGRDYHKVIRSRLVKLWQRIESALADAGIEGHSGRVFTDSAPVLEKALAERAGLGWIGKNTLLLNREAGSWFFLGEIYTTLPLTVTDAPPTNHCGSCSACIDVCPTDAIVAPYELDATRCISYFTIEKRGEIPIEFRRAMGNRIFGCDDCQLFCPWNKFAHYTAEEDFSPRHELDTATLLALFTWTAEEFDERTQGSAIRRAGYDGWLRNIAVALGNGPAERQVIEALENRWPHVSEMVREHIDWALAELRARATPASRE